MWNDTFVTLFACCVELYQSGNKDFPSYYSAEELKFLSSIGYQPREFFDFIEDFCEEGKPTLSTALLVASVRRDYFLTIQEGKSSGKKLSPDDLPTFGDTINNIPYLPRILAKARAKLRGELDPDIMFGCGGDRNFLEKHGNIPMSDFLRHVWSIGDNVEKILKILR
jgi:hypothetical protein